MTDILHSRLSMVSLNEMKTSPIIHTHQQCYTRTEVCPFLCSFVVLVLFLFVRAWNWSYVKCW